MSTSFHCCSMCGKQKDSLVDLSSNEVMRTILTKYWKVSFVDLENTLRELCIQCVYKINAHKEMTVSLELQLQRNCNGRRKEKQYKLTETNSSLTSSPECNDSIPHFSAQTVNKSLILEMSMKSCTSEVGKESLHMNCALTSPGQKQDNSSIISAIDDRKCQSPHLANKALSDEPLSVSPTRLPYIVDVEDITPEKELQPPQSVATVDPDQDVSRNIIESESEEKCVQPKSSAFLSTQQKHTHLNVDSLSNSAFTSSQDNIQSMLQVFTDTSDPIVATVSSENITHLQRQPLKCQYCTREYKRKVFFIKHMRRCSAQFRFAHSKNANSYKRKINSPIQRLKPNMLEDTNNIFVETRTIFNNNQNLQYESDVNKKVKQRYFLCSECGLAWETLHEMRWHKRSRHMQSLICDSCGKDFTAAHDFDFHQIICKAKHEVNTSRLDEKRKNGSTRPMTRAASRAVSTFRLFGDKKSDKNHNISCYSEMSDDNLDTDSEMNYDGDDTVSVADSMYSRRMNFTCNWLEDLNNTFDYDDNMKINTFKEHDLYLLELLKEQIQAKKLKCFVPHCEFYSETLLIMMLHDYSEHYKGAWFYCHKCNLVFTSKVFLDYHIDRQNSGRYICFKCGDCFEFQHQLDRHLIRHSKCINYRCNYCSFQFLTEDKLLQHCKLENHNPNSERKLIEIHRDLTISQQQKLHEIERESAITREYNVHILEWHLPHTPLGQSINLSIHKRKPRIGDVEFNGQRNPNCLGWK